jgi:hypothetical protein
MPLFLRFDGDPIEPKSEEADEPKEASPLLIGGLAYPRHKPGSAVMHLNVIGARLQGSSFIPRHRHKSLAGGDERRKIANDPITLKPVP